MSVTRKDGDKGPQAPSLTTDGISEEFFELLWSRDELNFGPSLNIPDTIIFKYGQPVQWYFTAKNGRVKKKNRANLIGARIEEAFTKHILGYDVIASFVMVPVFSAESGESGGSSSTTIEFLDREGLTNFLYNRKKEDSNGILQRFVEPKGVKNEVIRAVWSPKVCLLERAENIHQLHDHRYGLYERCVTLEGPEYYITSAPLRGPVLAGQIQKICENIVSHLSEVTFGQKQITRLVANFKVDSRDKIWLMYTTSIRLNDMLETVAATAGTSTAFQTRQLVNIDNVVEIPSTINLNPVKSFDKVVAKKRVQCVSCALETLEDMRHPITYKSVVKHYEHVLHIMGEMCGSRGQAVSDWPPSKDIVDAAGGVGFGCLEMVGNDDAMRKATKLDLHKPLEGSEVHIPPILRYLHPKLTGKSYYKCRKDPLFLYKTATVCEPCYLVYAEFTTMLLRLGGDLNKMLTPDPSAVKALHEASISSAGNNTRPSSADWRALSTVNRSSESLHSSNKFVPSQNHKNAKQRSIGLRSSDARHQPAMPRTIRKLDDAEPLQAQYSIDSYGSMMHIPTHANTQMSLGRSVSMGQLGAGSVPFASGGMGMGHSGSQVSAGEQFDNDLSAMIQERERNFFKEISKNPQLKDQHPLMHLISAHQKLKMADEASGVVASKASSQKKSLFGTRYGKQAGDQFDPLSNIYGKELPYMFRGELIAPSEWRKQKEAKVEAAKEAKRHRQRQKKAREAMMNAPTMVVGADGQLEEAPNNAKLMPMYSEEGEFNMFHEEPSVVDVTSTKSAQKHREFLRETLQKLEGEADKSADYLPGGALAGKRRSMGGSISGSVNGSSGSLAKPIAAALKAVGATPGPGYEEGVVVGGANRGAAAGGGGASAGIAAGNGKSVKILAPLAPAPFALVPAPASPTQYPEDENSLENFFQLASAGGDSLPPRSDVKSAGIRDARTADSSRPSTTAASKRAGTPGASSEEGAAVAMNVTVAGSGAVAVRAGLGQLGLPDIAGDASVVSVGSFSVVSDNSSAQNTAFFEGMNDAAPSSVNRLLVHWGADHVHSEARDDSLLNSAALADELLREGGLATAHDC